MAKSLKDSELVTKTKTISKRKKQSAIENFEFRTLYRDQAYIRTLGIKYPEIRRQAQQFECALEDLVQLLKTRQELRIQKDDEDEVIVP